MRSITLHTSPHTRTHTCTRNDATVKFPQMNSRWNLSILTSRVRLTCKVQCWLSINVTRGPRAKYLLPNANDEHRLIYQHRQEASAHQHIVHATATFDRQQGETAAFGEWNEFSGSQKLLHCIRFQHYRGIWWLSTLTLSLSPFFSLVSLYPLQAVQTIQLSAVMTLQLASEHLRVSFVKLSFLF